MGGVAFLIVFIVSLVFFTLSGVAFWTGMFVSFMFAIAIPFLLLFLVGGLK